MVDQVSQGVKDRAPTIPANIEAADRPEDWDSLIDRNIRWVRHRAPSTWRVDWEALTQDLRLRLWKGMKKWRPGGSAKRSYAIWILGSFWAYWWSKMERRAPNMPQFRDQVMFTGKVSERSQEMVYRDSQDATAYDTASERAREQLEAKDAIEYVMKELSPREREWLQTYLDELPSKEIPARLGVENVNYARNARSKVRRKARKLLEQIGVTV